ncbi:GNAT family N-acetyltransferase [uncultured Methanobrevibacter sp.]|uniref:GNAT family N-acetyltransferase n=1 Tax=uncultured Methanobrevibacter sp. TaxID=253161 RepID=UPI0026159341
METVLSNEKDERFIQLSNELNNEYFSLIGEDALKYEDYNNLEDPHIVLLVLNWGNPIACASYKIFDKDSIEIKRVYVKKRYRNKRIAYKMVKALEKLAIEDNFKYSYITTGKDNIAAINLYKKLGYELIDNFGFFEGDDLCICMKKEFKTMIF